MVSSPKFIVYVARTAQDRDTIIEGCPSNLDRMDMRVIGLRWTERYKGYTCRIRIDGVRCQRIVTVTAKGVYWVRG